MIRLVQVSLALSAAALAIIVIADLRSENKHHFLSGDEATRQALTGGALVLAADSHGAVTETGNGAVRGWRRGESEPIWRDDIDRFDEDVDGQTHERALDAVALCAEFCPAALLEFDGRFSAYGASAALAGQLNSHATNTKPLAMLGASSALVLTDLAPGASNGALAVFTGNSEQRLPAGRPSVAYADATGARVVAGSPDGAAGILSRSERVTEYWRTAAPAIKEDKLQNLCISADGRWVGAVATRTLVMAFGAERPKPVGQSVAGGICRADAGGVTAVVNPAEKPGTIVMIRFDHEGRRIWRRAMGAQQLLSPTGSPLVVTKNAHEIVTVVDAVSGRLRLRRRIPGRPLVAADGSIVVARRDGRPRWIDLSAPAP